MALIERWPKKIHASTRRYRLSISATNDSPATMENSLRDLDNRRCRAAKPVSAPWNADCRPCKPDAERSMAGSARFAANTGRSTPESRGPKGRSARCRTATLTCRPPQFPSVDEPPWRAQVVGWGEERTPTWQAWNGVGVPSSPQPTECLAASGLLSPLSGPTPASAQAFSPNVGRATGELAALAAGCGTDPRHRRSTAPSRQAIRRARRACPMRAKRQ